ncbi:hypothetical protein [Deinococcus soli (ex Cha et al. 2016)]|uniref:Uncharacterized protein n=2 Tax=Deinococcus soli (ex Cha et al. 2016) TaxID=1309411 RepID=A0AAE4BNP6_9DEIO|nr:hypothetical protein [Deinococcus soli (ex Cha et al. 2016)]MDR6218931.1 hypothetical protein [Deinococcus soli (ex Cha et al. 2016)]MDR6328728.1 hypothetical protein [Deinococcus soli (ex Cha et al. 2016)]MDR6751785.1 hypothetical protein [Deinococcus soli (ex Cha et al. 2016)]
MHFTTDPHPHPPRSTLRSAHGHWLIHTDDMPGDAQRITLEHASGTHLADVTVPPTEPFLGMARRPDYIAALTLTDQLIHLLRPLEDSATPDEVRAVLPTPLSGVTFSDALWHAMATAAWGHRPPPGTPPLTVTHLDQTVLACPSAWEGHTDTGQDIYIRYRHGGLSVSVQGTQTVWMAHGDRYAGVMSTAEMTSLLADVLTFQPVQP